MSSEDRKALQRWSRRSPNPRIAFLYRQRQSGTRPSAALLAIFAWLLTLHPSGAARPDAPYGGVYTTMVY
jgi:drug/metabolite transporter superfamily protein YnfA